MPGTDQQDVGASNEENAETSQQKEEDGDELSQHCDDAEVCQHSDSDEDELSQHSDDDDDEDELSRESEDDELSQQREDVELSQQREDVELSQENEINGSDDDIEMNDFEDLNYQNDEVQIIQAGSSGNRRPPGPPPPLQLQCLKMSSFVVNHANSVETIQYHPASLILPPECLQMITEHEIEFPIHFELVNPKNSKATCCGVSMFTADAGTCSIPDWIMENLSLEDGNMVSLVPKSLVQGEWAKLEPQHVNFLEIKDPKEALEEGLSKFACISTGDIITIFCQGKFHKLKVLETKPGLSIRITDSDLKVDFAPPVGYVEPGEAKNHGPFPGNGQRLDGQPSPAPACDCSASATRQVQRGLPDWTFQVGKIDFNRRIKPKSSSILNTPFKAFSGQGFSIGDTNAKPNNDGDSSDAKPNKIPRTENALDVSDFTSTDRGSIESQSAHFEEINEADHYEDYSEGEDEDDDDDNVPSSDEDDKPSLGEDDDGPSSEEEDPNDPDYIENMEIC